MDTSVSSDELDTSVESLYSVPEGQTLLTGPPRPSPFTLRSQCASSRCPQGTGILFRSRISPSPSKTRVRSRRRRRSDQSRQRNSSDSSSFLEISHHHRHDPTLQPLLENEHIHHHHHQNGGYHRTHHQEDYPSDGIHNIDHHHVHVQDRQLHMRSKTYTEDQHVKTVRPLEPLQKEIQHIRFEDLQKATAEVVLRSQAHSITRADILFEEFQKEEAERLKAMKKRTKKRTVTTNESTTTTVTRNLVDPSSNGGPPVGLSRGVTGLAETVKNTVFGFLTPSKEKSYSSIVESSESGFEDGSVTGEKDKASTPKDRFIPAREFFAEADRNERLSSGYFSGTDTPSKLRESTRRLSLRKPHNQYIAYSSDEEYDDWKHQPKTDYTYSASLTYRNRVTPDRKIGSPNMSRRTLKGGIINYVESPEFSVSESSSEDSNSINLRSRTIHKAMDGALAGTGEGEENYVISQNWSKRSSRSPSYDITRTNGSLTRTMTTTTTAVRTTRTLHTGLDAESDVDDGTESAVPLRATPLTARSGTPVGRSITPVAIFNSRSSSSRRSSVAMDAGKGYNLRESSIAEDLEEEEIPSSTVVMWSRKTWHTITRITTIITASIAMMAASAVTSSSKDEFDMPEKKTSRFSTFMSTVSTTKTRVVTTLIEKYTAVCEHLRKNPIWLWIPLLFLLLLLALIAHWLLLQSRGKTADPTENDGSSFFTPLLLSAYDLAYSAYSRISSSLVAAWVSTVDSCAWLASACFGGLTSAWTSVLGMFTWLWSLAITCVTSLLQWLVEFLRNCTLAVLGFFTSSASYIYGFCAFYSSNETVTDKIDSENDSWGIVALASKISPVELLSETYVKISEGVQSSGTMLWNGWLWLIVSVGELLSALAGYTMWLFSMIWYALIYLVTGLWTVLTYILYSLMGFLFTSATTILTAASNTSAAFATGTRMIFGSLFASSDNVVTSTPVMIDKPPEVKTVENIVQQSIHFKEGTVEEIVRQVLESEELKGLIAAAVAESSKEQLTIDTVSGIAKSVVERELGVIREEIKASGEVSAEQQHNRLREEKELLIMKLQEIGQRLYNVEGKVEVADKRSVEERQRNEEQIEQILLQFKKLEEDHANLAMDVKSCCEDKNIPAVLGEIFGVANYTEDGKIPLSAGDIGAWLKSYFVAKEELENRLNNLMATMQLKTASDDSEKNEAAAALTLATVEQTKQIVMDTVLEKLRSEMKQQQINLSEEAQKQVSEQINLQVKAAAGILGEQVLEQVQLQVQNQKQQLSETLKVNVDSAVQEAMTNALPETVNSAVETAVNSAVEKAVSASVDVAVTNAVDTAVPAAVNKAVPQAVRSAVPEAVAEILPNAVAEQVATAVPEVVASVLPAAVTSAVNETVTSAVSEAVVQIKQNTEKKEIVGIVGTTSANNSHDSGSLFVPGMHLSGGLNESAVIEIVKNALKTYDADKTGMVDHALESAGGNIVSTRCTENYQNHQAEVLVFGFPIYRYSTNNPRSIIQPDTMPGQCWAFKGSQGYIVIQLAGSVKPTGFTMEHIPKSLAPNGAIDSAPREFEVWGLASLNDEGILLGVFEYSDNGDPWQYFPVTVNNSAYFPYVELKINSNHGNLKYTCLYRFRVHGLREL